MKRIAAAAAVAAMLTVTASASAIVQGPPNVKNKTESHSKNGVNEGNHCKFNCGVN